LSWSSFLSFDGLDNPADARKKTGGRSDPVKENTGAKRMERADIDPDRPSGLSVIGQAGLIFSPWKETGKDS
jgi:hypothetical protein